ncbi:MAG TPA: hypothetical protein VIY48_06460 [Candidatus Paceibacterota bacterium]
MSIAHVQGNINTTSAVGLNSIAVTGSAVGSANCIAGIVTCWDVSGDALTSITDDKGNSYTVLDKIDDTNGQYNYSFVLGNITNGPATVTANFNTSVQFRGIIWDEYSGIAALANPTDGHGVNLQSFPAPSTTDGIVSPSITTTANGDLIYGGTVNAFNATQAAAGTGYTLREQAGTAPMSSEDKVQTTAGSVTATFTESSSPGSQSTFIIALKALGAGGGPVLRARSSLHAVDGGFVRMEQARGALHPIDDGFVAHKGIWRRRNLIRRAA